MGVAWWIVLGIHYCCCINYHDVRTSVFACVYMHVCSDNHHRHTPKPHTPADRGAAGVCAPLHAWTEHYVGDPTVILFNPNSNGLVRKADTFYYLSENPSDGQSRGEQIKRQ